MTSAPIRKIKIPRNGEHLRLELGDRVALWSRPFGSYTITYTGPVNEDTFSFHYRHRRGFVVDQGNVYFNKYLARIPYIKKDEPAKEEIIDSQGSGASPMPKEPEPEEGDGLEGLMRLGSCSFTLDVFDQTKIILKVIDRPYGGAPAWNPNY